MPCLDNVLNSPAGFSSCPEFKPILREARLYPDPAGIREPEPDGYELGPNLAESYSCDDDKLEEFRGNGEVATGKSSEPESDPEKLRNEANDEDKLIDGIERASSPCGVIWLTTEKLVQECSKRRIEEGIPKFMCSLPFLVGAPKLVHCRVCQTAVYPEEKIFCSVRSCQGVFHLTCAKEGFKFSSSKKFKCPQHACFLCNQKNHLWRCIRCPIACHDKCAPFPEHVNKFPDRPGEAICWRHPADWQEKVLICLYGLYCIRDDTSFNPPQWL